MQKDPAFLFYPKDWLQGTSQMMPDEKGVYIDLLSHQHQEGDLPSETKRLARMVGLGEVDFLKIWEVLKSKFILTSNNRLVNRKLSDLVTERLERGRKNKIIGTMASVFRLSVEPYDLKVEAKKTFDVNTFLTVSDENLTEVITDWFLNRLKSIGNGNGNGNANTNTDVSLEGSGEPFFKENGTVGLVDESQNGLTDFARKIGHRKGKEYSSKETELYDKILSTWFEWFKKRNDGHSPKFTSRSGKSIKEIYKHFICEAKKLDYTEEQMMYDYAYDQFALILSKWEYLSTNSFLYSCVDITKISGNLTDIINFLNNGSKTNRGVYKSKLGTSDARTEANRAFGLAGKVFLEAIKKAKVRFAQLEEIDQLFRSCFALIGLRAQNYPNDMETLILYEYLQENYGEHTTDEIFLAFKMAIQGKLNIGLEDVKCYENFSCLYLSSIMTAYRSWASQTYRQLEPVIVKPEEEQKYLEGPRKDAVPQWPQLIDQAYIHFLSFPDDNNWKTFPTEFYNQLVKDEFIEQNFFRSIMPNIRDKELKELHHERYLLSNGSTMGLSGERKESAESIKQRNIAAVDKKINEYTTGKKDEEIGRIAKNWSVLKLFMLNKEKFKEHIYMYVPPENE